MARDDNPREALQRRALTAMLSDAFFTWPSAVLIGFAIIAFFLFPHIFIWWQAWYWIVFGVIAESIYLWATMTDPVAAQQAVSRMLVEKYDPKDIKNLSARQRLQKALEYKRSIDEFVDKQSGALKVSLSNTATEINEWIGMIYRLAKAIDTFESNSIIDRDRRAAPTELADLKRRINAETDPGVRAELQEAIDIREQLLNDLQTIANNAKRTDIKLDNTIALLSRTYAQMQLLDSKAIDGGKAQRLHEEIKDEIASLSDIVHSMDEVYNYQGYKGAVNNLSASTDIARSATTSDADSTKTMSRGGGNG